MYTFVCLFVCFWFFVYLFVVVVVVAVVLFCFVFHHQTQVQGNKKGKIIPVFPSLYSHTHAQKEDNLHYLNYNSNDTFICVHQNTQKFFFTKFFNSKKSFVYHQV